MNQTYASNLDEILADFYELSCQNSIYFVFQVLYANAPQLIEFRSMIIEFNSKIEHIPFHKFIPQDLIQSVKMLRALFFIVVSEIVFVFCIVL